MKTTNPLPINEASDRSLEQVFHDFCQTIATLRDPSHGCPWDLKQDHMSLRTFMLEESYEAVQAMESGNPKDLCEELGDVLLQVVLNAQIASDLNNFNIFDVIKSINEKMIRRHPHVFKPDSVDKRKLSDLELKENWEQIKTKERASLKIEPSAEGLFESKNVQKVHPASKQAAEIGKIASSIKFDWDKPAEVLMVLIEEVRELEEAFHLVGTNARAAILDEIGDVFFCLSQLCRHLNVDPELVAQSSNNKFLKRFRQIEKIVKQEGLDIRKCEKSKLSELWTEAKRQLSHV